MIRRLIILLLIVGCGFAQDVLILLNGKSFEGEYITSVEETIVFRVTGAQKSQSVHISRIQKVVLADGAEIYNKIEPEMSVGFDSKMTRTVGGILIAAGGGMMAYTANMDIESIEDVQTRNSGYFFSGLCLIIGGALLAIGD